MQRKSSMNQVLSSVYLARHGETEWSLSGQHTGLTDLPLTPRGELNARSLGERLNGMRFAAVFTSPLQRAARMCELAGFGIQEYVRRPADISNELHIFSICRYEVRAAVRQVGWNFLLGPKDLGQHFG